MERPLSCSPSLTRDCHVTPPPTAAHHRPPPNTHQSPPVPNTHCPPPTAHPLTARYRHPLPTAHHPSPTSHPPTSRPNRLSAQRSAKTNDVLARRENYCEITEDEETDLSIYSRHEAVLKQLRSDITPSSFFYGSRRNLNAPPLRQWHQKCMNRDEICGSEIPRWPRSEIVYFSCGQKHGSRGILKLLRPLNLDRETLERTTRYSL